MRRVLRSATLAAASTALFFVGAQSATAAGTARLDIFPDRPRAAERATLQLRTYRMLPYPGRTPPAVFPADYPMVVALFAPGGRRVERRLARDARDPHLWQGSIRIPSRGRWTVCGANFQFALDIPCATTNPTRRHVHVRARGAATDVWHRLQRPLALPSLQADGKCPAAAPSGNLSSRGFGGHAWGPGPAYPVGLGSEAPVLRYLDPIPRASEFFGSAWFGNKVLWFVDRDAYQGPVLIRGRQLDGPSLLRFERGHVPPRELRIVTHAGDQPSYTRVRAPGCYAYQVDGLGFGYTIAFRAEPVRGR
ncbi:MAG: hypothetical protein H0V68_09550 [Actinobacteria bacterium]|nr:hypothetical protein [Actinomycetota bacterium]